MQCSDYIAHLDGFTVIAGGWLNHNYRQLGIQLADSVAGGAYSFVGTTLILLTIDLIGKFIPILRLRADDDAEVNGIDDAELGEFAVSIFEFMSVLSRSDHACSMTMLRSHEMYTQKPRRRRFIWSQHPVQALWSAKLSWSPTKATSDRWALILQMWWAKYLQMLRECIMVVRATCDLFGCSICSCIANVRQ